MKLRENSQELLQDIARKPPSYDALMIALSGKEIRNFPEF